MREAEADLGGLIRQLRDARGWTQEQLAHHAGITVTCLSNLERGATRDPKSDTLAGLAAAFGLDPTELDSRRLGEVVAERARSFLQRQAITRLLDLPDSDIETIIQYLKDRKPKRQRRGAR